MTRKFTLTNSQKASLAMIAGLVLNAAYSSYQDGSLDWKKFGYALIGAALGACRSLSATNSGTSAADTKAATAQTTATDAPSS
jgi:uncharacterized membrane protein YfcA